MSLCQVFWRNIFVNAINSINSFSADTEGVLDSLIARSAINSFKKKELKNIMCRHTELNKPEFAAVHVEICPGCDEECRKCKGCGKWRLGSTLDKYDGKRCLRCYDTYMHQHQKGIYNSKSNKRAIAASYGFYRKQMSPGEWIQPSRSSPPTFVL